MRTRLAPAVLIPLLALTGCSSGSSAASDTASQATPTALATTAAPSAAAAPTAAAPAGASTAPSATGAGAGATPGASAAAAASSAAVPITTVAPGRPAATRATAPGTYTSDASGTIMLGTSKQDASGAPTLTVGPLKGDRQHSSLHGDQGDTDQDLLIRDTGTYIASLRITSPAFAGQAKEFHPPTAVLLVPAPAKEGSSWSWKAVSTDGKTTVTTTNKIDKHATVVVGGLKVLTAVVETHLVLSGDVTYDAQVTTYYSEEYRLAVKDHTVGKGTAAGFPFTTDITTLLRSVKAA